LPTPRWVLLRQLDLLPLFIQLYTLWAPTVSELPISRIESHDEESTGHTRYRVGNDGFAGSRPHFGSKHHFLRHSFVPDRQADTAVRSGRISLGSCHGKASRSEIPECEKQTNTQYCE